MEEKKFCQYCGSPIDSEAKIFVPNVERALIASRMLPFRRRFISRLTL